MLVARIGSIHQAAKVRFVPDPGDETESISIFACPLADGRKYAVIIEPSSYAYLAKDGLSLEGGMPDYMVRFCGLVDDNKSYGAFRPELP